MKFENGLFVGGLLAVVLMLAGWAIDQPDDLEQEQALYCEMVATHKATGGEYARACK